MMTEPREWIVSYTPGSEPWYDIGGNVTEIVRCRDCKYYAHADCPYMARKEKEDLAKMDADPFAIVFLAVHYPDGYCAWGVRADD